MEIFTIGYSAFNLNEFIAVLKEFNIKCLVDVRSLPYSQLHSEYNKEHIEKILEKNGILYRHYGKEFGARQENVLFYSEDGFLDFNKFSQSEQFQSGLQKITKGIKMGYSFALMCAEKDPINCHRCIMVGKGFKDIGFEVKNIINKTSYQTQNEIEERLLDIYFSDRKQLSLFTPVKSDEVLIKESYINRNKEIAYHLGD